MNTLLVNLQSFRPKSLKLGWTKATTNYSSWYLPPENHYEITTTEQEEEKNWIIVKSSKKKRNHQLIGLG
jgi:hypothetical protein